jgi:formylglycine-generating enzyme required for sulfatase activity
MRMGSQSRFSALSGLMVLLLGVILIGGCSKSEVGPSHPTDSTPPATVQMQIDVVTAGTITFTWRAPGDDGISGLAAGYDLRYSTTPLTEENWLTGTPALGNVTPDTPNSFERFTISGLTPATTYYFSLKTYDEIPNYSGMATPFCVTIPTADDDPIPLNGTLLSDTGTTQSGFVFQLNQLIIDDFDDTGNVQGVVIDDSLYTMIYIPLEFDDENRLYEFATMLETGSHEYYFLLKESVEAQSGTRMPSSGAWTIDAVENVTPTEFSTLPVTAGTFQMGNPDPGSSQIERPQHGVTLTTDLMASRFEITNAQVCEAYNWALEQELIYVQTDSLVYLEIEIDDADNKVYFLLRCAPREHEVSQGIQYHESTGFTPVPYRENWPATHISWFGAIQFCNFKSMREELTPAYIWDNRQQYWRCDTSGGAPYSAIGWRLPSEAEWEYMAQYNDGRTYVTGNTAPAPGADGNIAGLVGEPVDVGSYPAGVNELGIEDLVGNVWEWCNDWNKNYDAGEVTDPSVHVIDDNRDSRIMRGGGWGSPIDELRCIQRFAQRPTRTFNWLGFRCVRSDIVDEG